VIHVRALLQRSALAGAMAAAATIAAVAATGLASASPTAPTSSNNCATGIYAGYCGTQVDSNSPQLSIAVGNWGQIVGSAKPHSGAADWFWFAYDGGSNKIAEFAPNGVASNLVMAQQGSKIVLQRATGKTNQQWLFTCTTGCSGPTYIGTWKNVATGDILSSNGNGNPLTSQSYTGSPTKSESWTFVTP
jgi:hypothetical protein